MLYFRSTTFNNFQHVERHISTFNITWYTVQHLLSSSCNNCCSTKCWTRGSFALQNTLFLIFFREIGKFQSTWARFGKDKTMFGLTWTYRHQVDMSTLARSCDCNWSLRFLWRSKLEIIIFKIKIDRSVKNAVTGIWGSCRLLVMDSWSSKPK